MKLKSVKLAATLLTCLSTFFPRVAAAQISAGANNNVIPGVVVVGNDIAYDPVNNVYLSVGAYGPVYGVFVSSAGTPVRASFGIGSANSASFGHYPRAVYSGDLNGGNGGFLVTWHQDGYLRSVVVAYPTGVISAERLVSDGSQGGTHAGNTTGIAYSSTSRKFLVTWATGVFGVQGRFVDSSGAPTGSVTQYVDAGGANEPQVAWNSATDEFGLVYGAWNSVAAWVGFKRIPASGATPPAGTAFGFAGATFSPSIAVNTTSHHYIVGWSLGGGAKGTEIDQNGFKIADERLLGSRLGTPTSFELAYNPVSSTFLAISEDPKSIEIAGVELQSDGSPISVPIGLSSGASKGSYVPRVAARTTAKEWSISYSRDFTALANQLVSTATTGSGGGGGTPPPPPPPSCSLSINDNAASIPAGSSSGVLGITTGCVWAASIGASWLSASATSGSASASLQWTAQPNSGGARSGTITISGSGTTATLTIYQAGYVARPGDFNGDSFVDIIWENQSTGELAVWKMNGFNRTSGDSLSPTSISDTNWKIVAAADMNKDGFTDLIWQHDSGYLAVWLMQGSTRLSGELITQTPLSDTAWHVVGAGDFNRDGYVDVLWQHQDGRVAVWYMRGLTYLSGEVIVQPLSDQGWRVVGVADMNRDGNPDLVWHHSNTGQVAVWLMNRTSLMDGSLVNESATDTNWRIRALGDYDGDGDIDVLWQNLATGGLAAWVMNGTTVQKGMMLDMSVPDTNWKIVAPR